MWSNCDEWDGNVCDGEWNIKKLEKPDWIDFWNLGVRLLICIIHKIWYNLNFLKSFHSCPVNKENHFLIRKKKTNLMILNKLV
jgi:hypothetical protein